MKRLSIIFTCTLALASWGCGDGSLQEGLIKGIAEDAKPSLDAEEVSLTGGQVSCGVENGLWLTPEQASERSLARLTDKGRSLGFSDDVSIDEAGYNSPYVQVRGQIPIDVGNISSIRDGSEKGTKIVEARVAVRIQHECFGQPLPIIGIRRGKFVEGSLPLMAFYQEGDGWHFDKFVH